MRSVVYIVAAIAAIGIMAGIATMPAPQIEGDSTQAASAVSVTPEVMDDAGTLTMAVPTMHCEFSCFPKVKEALEGVDGVKEVVLDAQKEEGVVDNRQVVVTYEPGFDVTAAIGKLADGGFADSDVVQ